MSLESAAERNKLVLKSCISYCLRDRKTSLRLTNTGLNDQDMPELARLLNENPTITSVDLSVNNIRNGVAALAGCKYIEELYSEQNDFGDDGVIALANSGIKRLYLNGCNITDKAAQALLERECPNSSVSLVCCDKISKELLQKIRERNKIQKTKEQAEVPKKRSCDFFVDLLPGAKEKNISPKGDAQRKSFDKK